MSVPSAIALVLLAPLSAPPIATRVEPPPPSVQTDSTCEDDESACSQEKEEIRALLDESKRYKRAGSATMGVGGSFIALGIVFTVLGMGADSPVATISGLTVVGLGGAAMIGGGVSYGIGQRKFKQAQRDWEQYKVNKSVAVGVGAGGFVLRF